MKLVPTCYCNSCEMFVTVNFRGKCGNCGTIICFLQDENDNWKIVEGEVAK